MYGNCQVLSSMGGNVVADPLFPSPASAIRSQNMNFLANMPFHPQNVFAALMPKEEIGLLKGKEEELESRSGSGHMEGASGDEQQEGEQPKKKRYHRHTVRQIQEMEALFKECPHPDDKQRQKLSQELGLKPRQVKFWFQNRRTQMKAQQDRADNVLLRTENENLRNENFRLQAAIRNVICPNCGGPAILGEMSYDEQHLRLENARLKEELDRLSCVASRYNGRPLQALGPAPHLLLPSLDLDMGVYSRHFHETLVSCTDIIPTPAMAETALIPVGLMEPEKPLALELASSAMDELVRLAQENESLWIRSGNEAKEILNIEEYSRFSPWPINLKQHHGNLSTEATRDSALVIMNSITLVDVFLDANKWMEMFPSIVSRAKTVQIITPGVSSPGNGSLQLMYAELQALSPLVPTREAHFLRYCLQNVEEGTWAIVDFPTDSFNESLQPSFPRYRRRPSGCVIQDMPNGYSRVTWVEHAEVEDKQVHQIFNQLLNSGLAFGAQRWLAVLQRQCERLASLMARNMSERDLGVIPSPEARKSMMKLAQRMIRSFCVNMSSCGGQSWTALSGSSDDTVRITTRKNVEPGQPNGVILSAVSTNWLPFPHNQVFDLLRDERRRSQLDVLSNGNSLQEVAHIANGSHPGNCISLLRVNAASNSSQNVELMLQESCTDAAGSLIVYAPIDVSAANVAMSGADTSYIPLLPSGFAITPESGNNSGSSSGNDSPGGTVSCTGCLLTVGFQVLASTVSSSKLNLSNVTAINNHICNVVNQITAALNGSFTEPPGSSEQQQ